MTIRTSRRAALAGLAAGLASGRAAAGPCSLHGYGIEIARAWSDRRTLLAPKPPLSMSEALCIQEALVEFQRGQLGDPIGWKLGLTSAAMRRQLGIDRPIAGRLLSRMLQPEGASFRSDFGARPAVEADMLVTVKDEWVNDARTPMDVALHLLTMRPFIELPDLMLAEGQPFTAETAAAVNVGARHGVYGREISVFPTREFVDSLAKMQVTLSEGTRNVIGKAPGAAILDHPFNAVIELASQLYDRGERLSAGDMISLGSFGPPGTPRRGQTYTARYDGIAGGGPIQVSVAIT
jgi:2-keto-4-pentenoate hydratase